PERDMAKIERFEEIEAWKKARVLTNRVYTVTNAGAFARDFELRGQIRRASVSIMSNIAEGFERGCGDKEFCRFLSIAKGSAGELPPPSLVCPRRRLSDPRRVRGPDATRNGRVSPSQPLHAIPRLEQLTSAPGLYDFRLYDFTT